MGNYNFFLKQVFYFSFFLESSLSPHLLIFSSSVNSTPPPPLQLPLKALPPPPTVIASRCPSFLLIISTERNRIVQFGVYECQLLKSLLPLLRRLDHPIDHPLAAAARIVPVLPLLPFPIVSLSLLKQGRCKTACLMLFFSHSYSLSLSFLFPC